MSRADILRAMTTGIMRKNTIMRKKFRISDEHGVFAYSDVDATR